MLNSRVIGTETAALGTATGGASEGLKRGECNAGVLVARAAGDDLHDGLGQPILEHGLGQEPVHASVQALVTVAVARFGCHRHYRQRVPQPPQHLHPRTTPAQRFCDSLLTTDSHVQNIRVEETC
jgi:hypothetical protein